MKKKFGFILCALFFNNITDVSMLSASDQNTPTTSNEEIASKVLIEISESWTSHEAPNPLDPFVLETPVIPEVEPLVSIPKWKAKVTWHFPPLNSDSTYEGLGATKSAAYSVAKSNCVRENLPSFDGYCNSSPKYVDYSNPAAGECKNGKIYTRLKDTGYPGSGHKSRWCWKLGFDGYTPRPKGDERPWGNCWWRCN